MLFKEKRKHLILFWKLIGKMLEISDKYTHSCKPMIGYKLTGIIDIKSDKIIAYTQPHESIWFVLKMKLYIGQI